MEESVVAGTSPRKSDRHFTYKDYKSWPEGERWELIDGEAYAMSPAPRRHHYFTEKPCQALIAPVDVFLPEGDEALDAIDQEDL